MSVLTKAKVSQRTALGAFHYDKRKHKYLLGKNKIFFKRRGKKLEILKNLERLRQGEVSLVSGLKPSLDWHLS